MWDAIWVNGRLATMALEIHAAPYGAIEDGALAVDGGVIAWVGPRGDLPGAQATLARRVHDLDGRWL
ncbi:MAG: imidazolonepropionase, partial [Proteobacteria bacterium]|nr:imidazolonepropionase [Pseudomonadota bacterium]